MFHDADLNGRKNDGRQSDPAVQTVQVRNGRLGKVVRVEGRLQTDTGQSNSQRLQRRVHELDDRLATTPEHAKYKQRCTNTRVGLPISK